MNADMLRHFYAYHFAMNRHVWDNYITPLSMAAFTHEFDYSLGSVRDQIFHLIEVDDGWFTGLLGQDFQDPPDQDSFTDLDSIRAYWDEIEQKLHGYLENLTDDDLLAQPLSGEDEGLYVWQVLLHVVNHCTDHRAQLLRLLNDLGVDTLSQDYMFYIYATAAR